MMSSVPSEPSFDARDFLATLTEEPGVYRMYDAEQRVLYVGKAKNLRRRVSSYFQRSGHGPRIALMLQQVAKIEITATRSEAEALILENTLIKTLAPKYNILFRDDKSYPYISLSGHEFPRLVFHRGGFEPHAEYFGPFPSSQAVRESIELLQKTFLLRTCDDSVFNHRSRPCLMYQIKRCKGPCVGLIQSDQYASDVRFAKLFLQGKQTEVIDKLTAQMNEAANALRFEAAALFRDQIKALQAVLHRQYMSSTGNENVDILSVAEAMGEVCVNLAMVRGGLHLGDRAFFPSQGGGELACEETLHAFIEQHYVDHPLPARLVLDRDIAEDFRDFFREKEVVADLPRNGKEKAWLAMAEKNAVLAIEVRIRSQAKVGKRLHALQEILSLAELPQRIECFDISHTMGEGTVASCVVCMEGTMRKSEYRRFNILNITPGDDYAAMRQALARRYEKVASGESMAPDLILIDGGRGQHRVAREVLEELGLGHLITIGIAKGEARKPGLEILFIHGWDEPLQLSPDHPGFHLIQEIRDEAHRFAIVGHRARRAKARSRSKLEDIPGVGPAKRRALLADFGGLDGVKAATIEDLSRTAGISPRLAKIIFNQLHGQ